MMMRLILVTQFTLLTLAASVSAGTTAKVLSVEHASAAIIPTKPPILLVGATGFVSDTGWRNPRLVPHVYVVPPDDGIWGFDFVADRVAGIHLQLITPVVALETIENPPSWVKGVRIHASTNSKEAELGNEVRLAAPKENDSHKSASISLDARYERDGSMHCVIATANVELGPISREYELGRYCIAIGGDCINGEKSLGGGVVFHWRLCIEDGGNKVCLYGKACKDFGFPVGELCTPEGSVCVSVDANATTKSEPTSATDEPGFVLDHKTLYVSPAVGGAHRFELKGGIQGATGAGTIVIDKNKCSLNEFGDRTTCTEAFYPPIQVRFSRLRLSDPAGQGREVYSISGNDVPKDLTLTLVIGRNTRPQVLRLVVNEDGQGQTAFPLIPKKEYDP
jgi:hypothetical protein